MDKINAPDVVRIIGAKPDDGAVLVIKTLPFLVAFGELQPFFSPDPFDLLVVDVPAFNTKELGNLSVAIAAILLCQSNQSQPKAVVI